MYGRQMLEISRFRGPAAPARRCYYTSALSLFLLGAGVGFFGGVAILGSVIDLLSTSAALQLFFTLSAFSPFQLALPSQLA